MTAPQLIDSLAGRGVSLYLTPQGDLKYRAPAGVITGKVRESLTGQKAGIVAYLREQYAKDDGDTVPAQKVTPPTPAPVFTDDLAAEAEEVERGYQALEAAPPPLVAQQSCRLVDAAYADLLLALRAAAFGNRVPPHEPVHLHPGITIPDVNRWVMLTLDRVQEITGKLNRAFRASEINRGHDRTAFYQFRLHEIGAELETVLRWWEQSTMGGLT